MKTIYIKYKDVTIGNLVCENNVYMYRVDNQGLALSKDKGYPIMLYFLDKDFVDARLPNSLKTFLPDKNTQMWIDANIIDTDSDFEKLYKIASQDLCDQELYISTTK